MTLFSTDLRQSWRQETLADGSYSFLVPRGEYRIDFEAPADWIRSPAGQGDNEALDSDAAPGEYAELTIDSGGGVLDLDVGLIQTGRIEGRVWHDPDQDGLRVDGAPDTDVASATVQLLDANLEVLREAKSDATGSFSFSGLLAGTYHIGYPAPAGVSISPAEADNVMGNDIDPATGRSQPFTVATGQITGSLIGISGLGSIGGTVWREFDGDGLLEPAEAGVGSHLVTLLDNNFQPLESAYTDETGAYRFASLLPGAYAVRTSIGPAAFSPENVGADESVDSDVIASLGRTELIPLVAGQNSTGQNAGWTAASGAVFFYSWHDADRDGVREEGSVDGIEFRLLDASGAVVATNLTALPGESARFQIFTPGDYRLEVVTPSGVSVSPPNQIGDEYFDSDFDPVTRQTDVFTVGPGGGAEYQFWAGVFGPHSISGQVWEDTDGDGSRDAGEAVIPGVQLSIEGFEDPAITPSLSPSLYPPWNGVVTDDQGNYRLDHVLPGVYGVSLFTERSLSPMNRGGDDAIDSDFNPLLSRTNVFRLDADHSSAVRDLGVYTPGGVVGRAWNDVNRDGVRQVDEQPVSNLAIRLLDASGQVAANESTDAAGNYRFDGVAPGAYTLELVRPTGTLLSIGNVGDDATDSDFSPLTGRSSPITVLSAQTQSLDAGLFGIGGPTTTGGTVWNDTDGDGVRETGESPASGVLVNLIAGTAQVVATQTTAADGSYRFENMASGQYTIEMVPPAGAIFSPIDRGGNEATDSDINRSTGRTVRFPLLVGQADVARDAGLYSGPLSSDAMSSLRITEIGFIGGGGSTAEFLELKNIGSQPLDLTGVALTRGVRFSFSTGRVRQLFPGEYVVVGGPSPVLQHVLDGAALLAGTYTGDLNQEERLTLDDAEQGTIQDFRYDDDWFAITRDERLVPWTFEIIDATADRRSWGNQSRWRPSIFPQGTPGYDETRLSPEVSAPTYAPGTIVINEILTKSSDGFNDRIELHNRSDQTVDIGGWYLGDTEETRELDDLTRYQIAAGTTIPPGGYLVLTRDQHFGNPDDPGTYRPFGLSSFGEAVNLTGVDSAGRLVGYSESHEYSGTTPDLTFGRHVTSTGAVDFPALTQSTIGGDNTAPRNGPVVINEFMYKPSQYLDEYIELHNSGDTDIDLGQEDWRIDVEGFVFCDPHGSGGGVCFKPGDVIPAGGYLLAVGSDPNEFRRKYDIPAEVAVVGPILGTLDGGGDVIDLVRVTPEGRSVVMDRVAFDDIFPWPEAADAGGVALERTSPTAYGNDPASWVVPRGTGGTPGRVNTSAATVDLNGDGRVGLLDLAMLQANFGSVGPALLSAGDVNADSVVNGTDFALWLCSFGQTTTTGPSTPAGQSPQAAVATAQTATPASTLRAGASRRAARVAVNAAVQDQTIESVTVSSMKLAGSRQSRLSRHAVDRVFGE